MDNYVQDGNTVSSTQKLNVKKIIIIIIGKKNIQIYQGWNTEIDSVKDGNMC